MNKTIGAVLVHGYTGSAQSLARLATCLQDRNPEIATTTVGLHECVETAAITVPKPAAPRFDGEHFVDIVRQACESHIDANRELVLIGHSTGGSIALEALAELLAQSLGWEPLLVVLASTPGPMDRSYAIRWHRHFGGQGAPGTAFSPPTLADMGRLARIVESAASRRFPQRFPVLVLHGERDELVPCHTAAHWTQGRFGMPPRHARLPEAGHDPFAKESLEMTVQLIDRDLADARAWSTHSHGDALFALGRAEPSLVRFFVRQPLSARHVVGSPTGWRALRPSREGSRLPKQLDEVASTSPVWLNVEITNRCPLSCPACARTWASPKRIEQDMSADRLASLLDIVPTAAWVTFVGLGEPLCHPEIERLVAICSEAARRTGVVTNAALLSPERGLALLEAGVDAVTFSLDALSPTAASHARPGANIELIVENIRLFTTLAKRGVPGRTKGPPTLAVFTALAATRAAELDEIAQLCLALGLDGLMVSDLNYIANRDQSLAMAASAEDKRRIRSTVARFLKRGLPIVGPRSLEDIGHANRPREVLLLPPDALWTRATVHTHCVSPWQTLAVAVDGTVSFCDCRANDVVGNVFERPLNELWNGPQMRQERARMRSELPSSQCLACPRF